MQQHRWRRFGTVDKALKLKPATLTVRPLSPKGGAAGECGEQPCRQALDPSECAFYVCTSRPSRVSPHNQSAKQHPQVTNPQTNLASSSTPLFSARCCGKPPYTDGYAPVHVCVLCVCAPADTNKHTLVAVRPTAQSEDSSIRRSPQHWTVGDATERCFALCALFPHSLRNLAPQPTTPHPVCAPTQTPPQTAKTRVHSLTHE